MSQRRAVTCLVAAVAGLAAGCTTTSAGAPRPTSGPSTSQSGGPGDTSAPQSSKPNAGPARPRELRLDGKDPCALIPQADRAKFYLERPGEPKQNKQYKSPECSYSTDVGGFFLVTVLTEGIEKWTDGSRRAKATAVALVAGFPAISLTIPEQRQGCDVAVDVAEGQYLLATVIVISSKAAQVPERCEYAHQLAESAMKTLVGA